MENNKNYNIKLGMFVSIGVLLLVFAVYIIGAQKNLFSSTYRLKTIFKNVSGLKVGGNVRFSGINVGTIDLIQIETDTSVKVEMVLQKEVKKYIRKDSRAGIGSEGLMGDKILIVSPGSIEEKQAEENDLLISEAPVSMDDILASVKVSSENLEIISDQLAEIVYNINNGNGVISKMINDDGFSKSINKTMTNLEKSSKGLNENMEAAKSSFLLKGYFKKKKKAEEKKQEEEQKKQEAAEKKATKKNQ